MYSRPFLIIQRTFKANGIAHFCHPPIRCIQTTARICSISQNNLADKVLCDIVKCSNANFRYDKNAKSLFQFESSPLINVHDISTANGHLDAAWLNNPDVTNEELVERLNFVSNYCREHDISITSEDFDKFIDNLTQKLSEFNENEVIAAVQIFSRMPLEAVTRNSRNFVELWMALDDHTARCAMQWDIDRMLAVCDVWIGIPLAKKTRFVKMICNKFAKERKNLPAQQLVRAVSFSNSMQKFDENNINFEKDLERVIDELSLDEVSRLCYTFNKSKARVQKVSLARKILDKCIAEDTKGLEDVDLKRLVEVSPPIVFE